MCSGLCECNFLCRCRSNDECYRGGFEPCKVRGELLLFSFYFFFLPFFFFIHMKGPGLGKKKLKDHINRKYLYVVLKQQQPNFRLVEHSLKT